MMVRLLHYWVMTGTFFWELIRAMVSKVLGAGAKSEIKYLWATL